MVDQDPSSGPLDTLERRRHSRSYVAGVALVSHPNHCDTGACLVRNLSTNGALLLSSPPLAPGETCRMVLTAPGLMGEQIEARVHRSGTTNDGAPWAAVEFVEMTEAQVLRLKHVIGLELTKSDAPAALIVDGRATVLGFIAGQLAHHSRPSHLANTALNAVAWLNERGRDISVAMIGQDILGTTASELLEYIGSEFPKIHRVVLDREASEDMLRRLLDRCEAEDAVHLPWHLSDFE